ncbi:uncharacterized protein LOC130700086 [Daphnia carinata]|uniref:uncharacterized protein LOC130700086 n=1 Tax=Daphnia carinata TaxID=120202 RepID=UPI0025809388|nr:uncharacterized protein LOC130700086 [Daphnia carinata]
MTLILLRKRTTCFTYLVLLHVSVVWAGIETHSSSSLPSTISVVTQDSHNGTNSTTKLSTSNEALSAMLEGGIFDDANNVGSPQLPTEAARTNVSSTTTSAPIDLPLFYPSSPNYQPGKRYGPLRETYHPLPARVNKDSFRRPAGLTPVKPRFLGFPPISNTRENVGLEINWAAKVGRAHRSFYDFLLA